MRITSFKKKRDFKSKFSHRIKHVSFDKYTFMGQMGSLIDKRVKIPKSFVVSRFHYAHFLLLYYDVYSFFQILKLPSGISRELVELCTSKGNSKISCKYKSIIHVLLLVEKMWAQAMNGIRLYDCIPPPLNTGIPSSLILCKIRGPRFIITNEKPE